MSSQVRIFLNSVIIGFTSFSVLDCDTAIDFYNSSSDDLNIAKYWENVGGYLEKGITDYETSNS